MTTITSSLRNQRVLVTGATGFIGSHLAQRLAAHEGAKVTGTGRRIEKASHLLDYGVDVRRMDVTDSKALSETVAGQDIVFHLAAAMGRSALDPIASRKINVEGTENLVRQAAAAGVRRFVLVSSIAVYGPPVLPVMDESAPLLTDQPIAYAETKAIGEQRSMELAGQLGLPLVVARPGIVYGPGSKLWTVGMLRMLQRRVPLILDGGAGHAHPVYVDNLVEGLILAATMPAAVGRAFNFVDGPLPWRDYFGYYARMCGRRPLRAPLGLARAMAWLFLRVSRRSESADALLSYYTNRSVYAMDKAKTHLAYRPRVSLEEAMGRTTVWLRENGYLGS